jgi:hypothetical protein
MGAACWCVGAGTPTENRASGSGGAGAAGPQAGGQRWQGAPVRCRGRVWRARGARRLRSARSRAGWPLGIAATRRAARAATGAARWRAR